jgi:hypothetical protein
MRLCLTLLRQAMRKNAAILTAYILFLGATPSPATALELTQEDGKFVQLADAAAVGQGKQDPKSPRGLAILQIGDSHTAADYFTGEVRRILQARFGDGGRAIWSSERPILASGIP